MNMTIFNLKLVLINYKYAVILEVEEHCANNYDAHDTDV